MQTTLTPIKAIRAKCLDCSNNQYGEVRVCPINKCPLWPYRMGRRPKADGDDVVPSDAHDEQMHEAHNEAHTERRVSICNS
ncbi:hypothetical protein [Geobacter pickeringii]|uniref:hypothetical protein n=1 Tax=Geobacter pickeringii TaxID=345632 RepID=UPI0009FC2BF8|nr:hypothetical protein [Geobacter pickeringii]